MWCEKLSIWGQWATLLRHMPEANYWPQWKRFVRAGSLSAGEYRATIGPPMGMSASRLSHRLHREQWRSIAITRLNSILMMHLLWLGLLVSSKTLCALGMRSSWLRLSHTG